MNYGKRATLSLSLKNGIKQPVCFSCLCTLAFVAFIHPPGVWISRMDIPSGIEETDWPRDQPVVRRSLEECQQYMYILLVFYWWWFKGNTQISGDFWLENLTPIWVASQEKWADNWNVLTSREMDMIMKRFITQLM